MFEVLKHRTYRHFFAAQATSLIGTGMMTVALGLLAYHLAGPGHASAVLGIALAIKMVVYVLVSPVVASFASCWPRKPLLISMDLLRAALVLLLPLVSHVWQIYALIAILQTCSAAFTPAFQATIPDLLPDEAQYTRALSLSRLAYDLENLLSPLLAALLLGSMTFRGLFGFTLAGFLLSALLVATVRLPRRPPSIKPRPPVLDGMRRYLATPRLRGMLSLSLAEAAGGALVIVNTVIYVRRWVGGSDQDVALFMAAFGGCSMLAALSLPRLIDRLSDRAVMLAGAALSGSGLAVLAVAAPFVNGSARAAVLIACWALIGLGYASILTPGGRLLKRSSDDEGRAAIFAAQFSLSHACWLIMYPLAGWLGTLVSPAWGGLVMGGITLAAVALAMRFWPAHDPQIVPHHHDGLPNDHPHVVDMPTDESGVHAHAFIIDDEHPRWPQHHPSA
ncbi:MFS transporter [Oleiagrimonas sp. MCCC 1A03011]|uniref:MFS transporter n=1 Tax=Oleiagrimonas sp. MCCC 1A03011 TaxID=1926883 RepID=UPI000DC2C542|nr:MFS transporter [Oleiagrimonas sp. MCCC 1A03011]RAP55682.1 MFS transporter [Oleiagrimonas sp. MCCC 1A03011]